jgi:hypothetical protein
MKWLVIKKLPIELESALLDTPESKRWQRECYTLSLSSSSCWRLVLILLVSCRTFWCFHHWASEPPIKQLKQYILMLPSLSQWASHQAVKVMNSYPCRQCCQTLKCAIKPFTLSWLSWQVGIAFPQLAARHGWLISTSTCNNDFLPPSALCNSRRAQEG